MLNYPFPVPPAPGGVQEITPEVLWLRMPLPFVLNHINLWLLREEGGYALIDCGYGDKATRTLWEQHFKTTLHNLPLTRILVTHYHPDHLGNAEWLMRHFACPLSMASAEFLTAHTIYEGCAPFSTDAMLALFRTHGMAQTHLDGLASNARPYRNGVPNLPIRYHPLHDGAAIKIGATSWRMILGRGHSPEHISFHAPEKKLLIPGDMLLPRISTNISVRPIAPDADPLADFLASLEHYMPLPNDTLVLPSHGLPFYGIAKRVAQLHEHHQARLNDLKDALKARGSLSATDALPLLFHRELDLQQRFFAMGESIAHLNHLWLQGKAARCLNTEKGIRFAMDH